jgi:endonuclease G
MENHMDDLTPSNGRGLAVVVNGTANFYIGDRPMQVAPPALVTPALPVATVEKKLRFDPDYDHRPGYKSNFLGIAVPLPGIATARTNEILADGGEPLLLKYHHYSLVMNQKRRLQMWSAVNVDYTPSKRRKKREDFGTDTWVPDPRVLPKLQIEDQELYDPAKKFDRGHIVRRDDTAWGDTAEEEVLANSDSFHWTNCTPQHEQFNRAMYQYHGLWGGLENQIQSQAKNVGFKMTIFAGPILDNQKDISHDFGGGPMKIPTRFWKVLFVAENAHGPDASLRAYGFVLDQSAAIAKYGLEAFTPDEFRTYQVRLDDIAKDAGVTFDKKLIAADALQGTPDEARRISIESLDDVRL